MMMRERAVQWWAGLVLCWTLLASAVAGAEPLAWVVERGGHRLVLMGSIHYGRADFYPLPPYIQAEFAAAEALAVELDITAVDLGRSTQLMMSLGLLPATANLQSVLGPEVYQQLQGWCRRSESPCGAFERLQPWVIALQVMESALAKSSLTSDLGVEQVLLSARQGKRLIELETLEQQLRLFADLDFATQGALLAQSLGDYGDSKTYLDAMADAWLKGDERALEAMLLEPLKSNPAVGARLMDALLFGRNEPMAAAAEQMLTQYRRGFFLVGVGHLVGRDSVIDHLRRRGLNVQPLSPAKAVATLD